MSELARINTFHNAYGRIWGADVVVFGFNRIVMDVYHKYLLRPKWIGKVEVEKIQVRYGILSILLWKNAMTMIMRLSSVMSVFVIRAQKTGHSAMSA